MRKAFLLLALSVITGSAAFAQSFGDVKFSGNLYSFYYWNLSSTQPNQNSFPQEAAEPLASNFNQFDIERLYLNVNVALSASTKFRATTDVYRNAAYPPTAGTSYIVRDTFNRPVTITVPPAGAFYSGLAIRLKYGYFDWAPTDDLSFRMGLQQTPWFDFAEQVWKYRGVQQTAGDKNKFMSSADLGFSANYNLPSHYGSLTAYLFNGNGYTAPEFNRFKDVAVRLQIVPLPDNEDLKGLKVTFMDYMGTKSLADQTIQSTYPIKNNNLGLMLSYQGDMFSVGAEYLTNSTGVAKSGSVLDTTNTANVISIYGSVKAPGDLKEYWELFARMDMYTPTGADVSNVTDVLPVTAPSVAATSANVKNTFIIAGLAYKPSSKLTFALDYQGTSFGKMIAKVYNGTATAPASASDSRIFIHGIVNF